MYVLKVTLLILKLDLILNLNIYLVKDLNSVWMGYDPLFLHHNVSYDLTLLNVEESNDPLFYVTHNNLTELKQIIKI